MVAGTEAGTDLRAQRRRSECRSGWPSVRGKAKRPKTAEKNKPQKPGENKNINCSSIAGKGNPNESKLTHTNTCCLLCSPAILMTSSSDLWLFGGNWQGIPKAKGGCGKAVAPMQIANLFLAAASSQTAFLFGDPKSKRKCFRDV